MPVDEITLTPVVKRGSSGLPVEKGQHYRGAPAPAAQTPAMVQTLAWVSIGLGLTEFLFPKTLARAAGLPKRPMLTRLMGLRGIAVGAGILAARKPVPWVKARIAGDALDLLLLKASFSSPEAKKGRLTVATLAAAGITAADISCVTSTDSESVSETEVHANAALAVNRSPEECYQLWSRIERLPEFIKSVKSVQVLGDKRSRWTAEGVGGKHMQWDAETVRDEPGRALAWRSLPGSDIPNSGEVTFEARPSGKGTNVRLRMEYETPGAAASGMAGSALQMISHAHLLQALKNFKSTIETGEVATTDGQPQGGKGDSR